MFSIATDVEPPALSEVLESKTTYAGRLIVCTLFSYYCVHWCLEISVNFGCLQIISKYKRSYNFCFLHTLGYISTYI